MRATLLAFLAIPSLSLAGCGGSVKPCDGITGKCTELTAGKSTESDVANAFANAASGSTIAFSEGTFTLTNTLTLQQKTVSVKGAGIGKTILDFKAQTAGSEGLSALQGSDGLTLSDFTVRDSKGNAIKVIGSTGVYFRRVEATWTGTDPTTHGAYGLYPVSCTNVLIEDSTVSGAGDAGIYVGQSKTIILRRNTAKNNVAGIEIENSFDADVSLNTATGNTGGILVFDLPGLPQTGGHNVRVFNNTITSNNGRNFASSGVVQAVPSGMGALVMANQNVEFFNNTVSNNKTAAFAVVSYLVLRAQITDPNYYPFPKKVYAHDNTFSSNGNQPDATSDLGALLASVQPVYPGQTVPTFLYDGIVDGSATGPADDKMEICFKNNGTVTFANLHFDNLANDGSNLGQIMTFDQTATSCTLTALPAVTVPGA